MGAEIEVRNVIFIAGQGTVVVGHIRSGVARSGKISTAIELGGERARRLEVSAVERLASMVGRGQAVGIVFRNPPNLNDLKRALPPGSVFELEDPSGSGESAARD